MRRYTLDEIKAFQPCPSWSGDDVKRRDIVKAIVAANEFTARAEKLLAVDKRGDFYMCRTRLSGSVKRQSLELSQALVELRRR